MQIFFLIQAGYQADFVFQTCVQAINNIYNRRGSQANMREADPEFYRLVSLFRDIQSSGAVGMRIVRKARTRKMRRYSFLMLLFAFTEKEGALTPLVTIPTG